MPCWRARPPQGARLSVGQETRPLAQNGRWSIRLGYGRSSSRHHLVKDCSMLRGVGPLRRLGKVGHCLRGLPEWQVGRTVAVLLQRVELVERAETESSPRVQAGEEFLRLQLG